MTSAEEHLKAVDWILKQEQFVWINFTTVPADISNKVFSFIEAGIFLNEYRIAWCKFHDSLFMITKIPKYDSTRCTEEDRRVTSIPDSQTNVEAAEDNPAAC